MTKKIDGWFTSPSPRVLLQLVLSALLLCGASTIHAQNVTYGFTPLTVDAEHLSAVGTGKSNTLDAAICLDPASDPVVARLNGQRIVGVRLFLRSAYTSSQQASNRYAFYAVGSLDATPTKVLCKFGEGWNEVMFPTPVEIGNDPIYIGGRVYETFGTPYPFCTYRGTKVTGGYFVRAGKDSEWISSGNGALLIQAILQDNETLTAIDGPLSASAHVSFCDAPLNVRPDELMDGSLFIHNQSAQPLTSVTFETRDEQEVSHTYTVDLKENPIPAYDGRSINYQVYAPSREGTSRSLTFKVLQTKAQGQSEPSDASLRSISFTDNYYVMKDAFVRIPLVEEYTSQQCVNCPMMAYYLDAAIEKWREEGKPIVYVAHHTGFADDKFTQATDDALNYLFGVDGSFNPAVMYDRRVFSGDNTPIHSAKVAEVSVYTECIEAVNTIPALAEVKIERSADGSTITVFGNVNNNFAQEEIPVYLNCYLIEDGIPTSLYPQKGLDVEGAPDDLVERFKHNGVVRHSFTLSGLGQLVDITTEGEHSSFSVTFPYPETLSPLPILCPEKTDIVAFLHLYDATILQNNYVLNAGSYNLTHEIPLSLTAPLTTAKSSDSALYDLQGRRMEQATRRGIYIQNGRKIVK